jgi:hypothetical protein
MGREHSGIGSACIQIRKRVVKVFDARRRIYASVKKVPPLKAPRIPVRFAYGFAVMVVGVSASGRLDLNTDLAMQMVAMNSVQTHNSVQIAVFKKAHDMQKDLLDTLMQTALSAPPPGQGTRVDKLA